MAALLIQAFGSLGLGATAAGIAGNLTASLLLSAASRALAPKGNMSQADVVRGLQVPTSLPPKRFVYGKTRVYGSWAAMKVKDGILYGCLILNSRPSDGGERVIYLDKRAVTLTGDVLDFAVGGSASNAPFAGYAKFWLGLGAQSGPPPQIMTEVGDATSTDPELFWPSDRWRGLTVLWVRLDRGPSASRMERWPRTPPEVEVEMRWSKVYDMRDAGQDAEDAATWEWRANQALCLLDAARQNPIRQRALRQIHLESFESAADVADEVIGGEARYEAHGVIVWDGSELMQQLSPLIAAGGGDLFQSGGRLGYSAGAYDAPEVTVSDVLKGQPFAFTRTLPARDVPRAVRARFVDPNAEYEMSELTPYPVPGGGGYDGGDDGLEDLTLSMVKSSTQAQRLQKARAIQASLQRRIACELPPACLNLIAGSSVQIDLPRAGDARNGVYKITSTHPAKWLESDDGVAFRLPIEAREISAAVWAWDPSEAVAPITSAFTPINLALAAPTDLAAATVPGGIGFDFLPDGTDAEAFEWQWQRNAGDWFAGGVIDADLVDGSGRVNGFLAATVAGSYLPRVRSVRAGRMSGWVTLGAAVAISLDLGVPTGGTADGGAGRVDLTFVSPNSADFLAMEIYAGPTSSIAAAAQLTAPAYGSANTIFAFAETGLGASVTRFYFARSVGPDGATSAFTSPVSGTTDPEQHEDTMTYELPVSESGGTKFASASEHNAAIVAYVEERVQARLNSAVTPEAAEDILIAAQQAATEAALYDGPKVDTASQLAAVTPSMLAVGGLIRVVDTGAVWRRVASAVVGGLDYSGSGGVRLQLVVPPCLISPMLWLAVWGQSNALGSDGGSGTNWITEAGKVFVYVPSLNQVVDAVGRQGLEPFNADGSNNSSVHAALRFAKKHGVTVGLVLGCEGSTEIEKWSGGGYRNGVPRTTDLSITSTNREIFKRISDGVAALGIKQLDGGIGWQGEADLDTPEDVYLAQAEVVFSGLKALGAAPDMSRHFVMVAHGMQVGPTSGQQTNRSRSWQRFEELNPNTVKFISSQSLEPRETNHFTSPAYKKAGEMAGDALSDLFRGTVAHVDERLRDLLLPPVGLLGARVGSRGWQMPDVAGGSFAPTMASGLMKDEIYPLSGSVTINLDATANSALGDGGREFWFSTLSNSDSVTLVANDGTSTRNIQVFGTDLAVGSTVTITNMAGAFWVRYVGSRYEVVPFPRANHSQLIWDTGTNTSIRHISPAILRAAVNAALSAATGAGIIAGIADAEIIADAGTQTVSSTANASVNVTGGATVFLTGTLTANTIISLTQTGVYNGKTIRVVRKGGGAFTQTVRDNVATGNAKALNTNQWVDFTHNGTAWEQSAFGSL